MKKGKKIIYGFRYQPQSKRSVKFSQIVASQIPENNSDLASQNDFLRNQVIFLTKQVGEWQSLRNQKQKIERQLFDSRVRIKDLEEVNFQLSQKIKQKQAKIQLIEQDLTHSKWQTKQAQRKLCIQEDLMKRMSKNSPLNQSSVLSILCQLEEQCHRLRQDIFRIQGIKFADQRRQFDNQGLIKLTDFQFEENINAKQQESYPKNTQQNTKTSLNLNSEHSQPGQSLQEKPNLVKLPQRINFSEQNIRMNKKQESHRLQSKKYSYQRYLIKQDQKDKSDEKYSKFDDMFD